jgi:very-short-patch-repair endonuclease
VIELDGQSHEGKEEPDEKRHKFLEEQGFKVVRFTNDRVLRDLLGVVKDIAFEAGIDIS